MTKRLFKMAAYLNKRYRCFLLFCLFCEEGEDGRQLGNDMFGKEPGYNGDMNLGSRGVFWPKFKQTLRSFFYFGPYILHLLFHKDIGFCPQFDLICFFIIVQKEHVFVNYGCHVNYGHQTCDYRMNVDWLEWSTKIGTRRSRYTMRFLSADLYRTISSQFDVVR